MSRTRSHLPRPARPLLHGFLAALILATASCQSSEGEPAVVGEEPAAVEESTADTAAAVDEPARSSGKVSVVKLTIPGTGDDKDTRAGLPKRWLGMTVANMEAPIPGAPKDCRTQIQRAMRGSPAHKAGLRRGDVIIAAGSEPVKRFQDYLAQARKVEIGELLKLDLLRDGRPFSVKLAMLAKPDNVHSWRRRAFPGSEAFEFSLPSLRPGGEGRSHDRASNKLQLLYFWATWCGPCRQIAPQMESLYKGAGDRLSLVAVSSEEEAVIRRHLGASSNTYPIAHDLRGELKQDYEVSKLPTAVLVGADGRVIAWDYGLGGVRRVLDATKTKLNL
jgi:thiol-disulfide isomerase/thioredoxin